MPASQVPYVAASAIRDYMLLNAGGSTTQYTDGTINSNTLAAQEFLETETGRWFIDRPATQWVATTMLRAQIPIPGFRTVTAVTWGGSTLNVATAANNWQGAVWPLPDVMDSSMFTAIQFRAFRAENDRPWWLADSQWFDKALDSPFYPGNWGGGYAFTSMPNDLTVTGDGGYDRNGPPPWQFLHAVKVLSSFYTMRPASILADTAMTPAGGVLTYSSLPAEVGQFIRGWSIGQQMVSAG